LLREKVSHSPNRDQLDRAIDQHLQLVLSKTGLHENESGVERPIRQWFPGFYEYQKLWIRKVTDLGPANDGECDAGVTYHQAVNAA
jgi:hypothetical protein